MCSHAVLDDDDGGMFDRASHVGFTARMVVLARVCGVFACDDDDNTLGFNDCDKSFVVSRLASYIHSSHHSMTQRLRFLESPLCMSSLY